MIEVVCICLVLQRCLDVLFSFCVSSDCDHSSRGPQKNYQHDASIRRNNEVDTPKTPVCRSVQCCSDCSNSERSNSLMFTCCWWCCNNIIVLSTCQSCPQSVRALLMPTVPYFSIFLFFSLSFSSSFSLSAVL